MKQSFCTLTAALLALLSLSTSSQAEDVRAKVVQVVGDVLYQMPGSNPFLLTNNMSLPADATVLTQPEGKILLGLIPGLTQFSRPRTTSSIDFLQVFPEQDGRTAIAGINLSEGITLFQFLSQRNVAPSLTLSSPFGVFNATSGIILVSSLSGRYTIATIGGTLTGELIDGNPITVPTAHVLYIYKVDGEVQYEVLPAGVDILNLIEETLRQAAPLAERLLAEINEQDEDNTSIRNLIISDYISPPIIPPSPDEGGSSPKENTDDTGGGGSGGGGGGGGGGPVVSPIAP